MKQSFFMERIAPPSLVRCEYGSLCSSDRGRSRVAPPPAGSQARPDRAAGARRLERVVVILLCGGTKRSQRRDIERAKAYWQDLRNRSNE